MGKKEERRSASILVCMIMVSVCSMAANPIGGHDLFSATGLDKILKTESFGIVRGSHFGMSMKAILELEEDNLGNISNPGELVFHLGDKESSYKPAWHKPAIVSYSFENEELYKICLNIYESNLLAKAKMDKALVDHFNAIYGQNILTNDGSLVWVGKDFISGKEFRISLKNLDDVKNLGITMMFELAEAAR